MNETELLSAVAEEYRNAIGVDYDEELRYARELALNYSKGVMPDLPWLEGRSKAVSTDVIDAIETALPDIVEIFTGEDVATFTPFGPEDEEAAQQETDYVNYVVFEQNDGFMLLYGMIKDALQSKIGVVKTWWEEYATEEEFKGKLGIELEIAREMYGDKVQDVEETEEGAFNFVVRTKKGKVCTALVPPEDFAVSRDTVQLRVTPYCCHRSRPRAMALIDMGMPRAKVDRLPSYGTTDEEMELARDTAGENDEPRSNQGDFRQVEVVEHYLRMSGYYWRVLTDATCAIILEKEKVQSPRFYAVTPYPVTHRFYGLSLADKLLEIQRIKTALTRMMLDSGYFALNQRMLVAEQGSNEHTLNDLVQNEPNRPVRVETMGSVQPLQSGGLAFDTFSALEYMSTEAEKRTGVVRNAQGLNPDTLHDTARGAMALMSAAQRRIRFIARIFAETGIKDLFLGVHELIRQNATGQEKARLRNNWVDIDPTQWGNRSDMTIDIGAGGQEAQVAAYQAALQVVRELAVSQNPAKPIVTEENVYALVKKFFQRGLKLNDADQFITDPAEAPEQEPQPNPAVLEAQAKIELEREKIEGQRQIAEIKAVSELETVRAVAQEKAMLARQEAEERALLNRQEHQEAMELAREKAAFELETKRQIAELELETKRAVMAAELQMQREQMEYEARLKAVGAMSQKLTDVQVGGEPG